MPNKLCAEEECEREYPVSDEDEKKWPLSGGETEILYARIMADSRSTRRMTLSCD
jgi:hypothetical protein